MVNTNGSAVAICIPTYNQAAFLGEAVLSALRQEAISVEVWVGDDASTDDTPSLMEALCQEHPTLRSLRSPINRGIAENSSWILGQPSCPLLVRLDSDDQLLPNYVSKVRDLMAKYPAAGYAHTAVTNVDQEGKPLGVKRISRPTGYQDPESALRASAKAYRTAANILTFRAEALRELNYYRGRPEFVEDYDLAVRMADAGFGNIYIDESLALYRVWNDVENRRMRRKHLQLQGYIRIFEESLAPAFTSRRWNPAPLRHGRRRLAIMNAAYCHQAIFSPEEQRTLRTLLYRLGDSPTLRIRVGLVRLGFGPVFQWGQRAFGMLKDAVKGILSHWRSITADR